MGQNRIALLVIVASENDNLVKLENILVSVVPMKDTNKNYTKVIQKVKNCLS